MMEHKDHLIDIRSSPLQEQRGPFSLLFSQLKNVNFSIVLLHSAIHGLFCYALLISYLLDKGPMLQQSSLIDYDSVDGIIIPGLKGTFLPLFNEQQL